MTSPALPICLGLALLSCKPFAEIDDHPCPPGDTQLRYEAFGAPFMAAHCQRCHGSLSEDRAGAPGDFVFDTVEQVRRHRARIYIRAAAGNDSMPPGPEDPPRSDRNLLADWLACGAP